MKDFGYGTLHTLRAHGVISDLAPGSGAAYVIFSGLDSISRGARTTFPHSDARLCTLEAVKSGLSRLAAECVAGDRILIETAWGSQLPFLPGAMRDDPASAQLVCSISDLLATLRSLGVAVSLKGRPTHADPELVRQASRALMDQRQDALA